MTHERARFNFREIPEAGHACLTMCVGGGHMHLVMLKTPSEPICHAVITAEQAHEIIDGLQSGLYRLAVEKDDGE